MKTNKAIKQTVITQQDIVELVIDELFNLGHLEGLNDNSINETITFELIQSYCNKEIEMVLKHFITEIEGMELDEFEFWFGFNTKQFLKEIKNKIQ